MKGQGTVNLFGGGQWGSLAGQINLQNDGGVKINVAAKGNTDALTLL